MTGASRIMDGCACEFRRQQLGTAFGLSATVIGPVGVVFLGLFGLAWQEIPCQPRQVVLAFSVWDATAFLGKALEEVLADGSTSLAIPKLELLMPNGAMGVMGFLVS